MEKKRLNDLRADDYLDISDAPKEETIESTEKMRTAIALEMNSDEAYDVFRKAILREAKENAIKEGGLMAHSKQMSTVLNFCGNMILEAALTREEAMSSLGLLARGVRTLPTRFEQWNEKGRPKEL